jgi:archaemetzincin
VRKSVVVAMAMALPFGGTDGAGRSGESGGSGGHALAVEPEVTIALAAVGDVDRATLEALAPVVAERFAARVAIAPSLPLPARAWDSGRRQWRASDIVDELARAKRPGWERLLGVADVDLYAPELNFVFGEADPVRGAAVFSLVRLHASNRALFVRRAETEAVHELGHTYGLGHCRDPHCVMWFSNTLAESDAKGTRFCAAHAAELAKATTGRTSRSTSSTRWRRD